MLLVDDNTSIHEDFRKILLGTRGGEDPVAKMAAQLFDESIRPPPRASFELEAALQGDVALDLVRRAREQGRPYALAFVDMRMPPGWNGIETTRRIWEVDSEIQIVICTAYSDYSWEAMVRELGSSDRWVLLKKPFDPVEIQQLTGSLTMKWKLLRQRRQHVEELERLVDRRTQELQATNAKLARQLEEHALMESELRRAHKLEALGRLTAGVGHEINNPLAFLLASLDFMQAEIEQLESTAPGEHLGRLSDDLGSAQIGARRIQHIVRDLNLFGRQDQERTEPLDIHGVLDLATNIVGSEVRARARLVKDYGEVLPVQGIQTRLEQVFVNLLVNAAQAIPAGRAQEHQIRVTTRPGEAGRVVVTIEDTGQGIPEQDLERIFDPFFTRKPVGVGTGLGLSICHGILTTLGGEIALESEQGSGTRVTVTLPAANPADLIDGARPTGQESPLSAAVHRRARILVVDDEVLVARALGRLLGLHEVSIVNSGREAIDLCLEQTFDIVFCDLMMDDLTGMDVHQQLSERRPGYEQRIVFITGGAYSSAALEFLESVPNKLIAKPFDSGAIQRSIKEAFDRE